MREPDDLYFDRPDSAPPPPDRLRTSSGLGPALGVAGVLLAATAVWYLWNRSPASPPETVAQQAEPAPAPAAPVAAAPTLPTLDASDALVRELAARLSAHPRLAVWLANDELVRRFVAAVVNLAEGSSPTNHLRFLTPPESLRTRSSEGRLYVDPASFRRYDLVTEVFVSLDAAGAAALYRRLRPLLDAAYREVGHPESSFDAALGRAIGVLLATPLPSPPFELVPQGALYAWADHRLEERTSAEKHLMRMGPENARRVQAKLRALAAALELRI